MVNRLHEPKKLKKPSRIFVCSMGDLFHERASAEMRESVFEAMRAAPWHTYIVLTKRPGRWLGGLPEGTWAGVTVELERYGWRVDELVHWHVGINFVSAEPLLGPLSLRGLAKVDWVIAGPETGSRSRPCRGEWIDALAAESPCFFDKRKEWTRREYPLVKTIGGA